MAELNSSIYINDVNEETKLTITEYINKLIERKISKDNEKRYYIGRIIINTSGTNPNSYLGFGNWEQYGKGKVLVGLDSNDTSFNTVNKTGGEKVHTLTTSEIPSHNHSFTGNSHTHSFSATSGSKDISGSFGCVAYSGHSADGVFSINYSNMNSTMPAGSSFGGRSIKMDSTHTHSVSGTTGGTTQSGTIGNSGSGNSHNNLQPYVVVYFWRRVA